MGETTVPPSSISSRFYHTKPIQTFTPIQYAVMHDALIEVWIESRTVTFRGVFANGKMKEAYAPPQEYTAVPLELMVEYYIQSILDADVDEVHYELESKIEGVEGLPYL